MQMFMVSLCFTHKYSDFKPKVNFLFQTEEVKSTGSIFSK